MRTIVILLCFLPLLSFGQTEQINNSIREHINHDIDHPVHSILFYVDDELNEFTYNEGFGLIDKDEAPITKHTAFKIASSTKLFVSTIILQLHEEGQLNLNDKVFPYLSALDSLNIENIHVLDGVNYSKDITIEQLLSHRSGLADIFTDQEEAFFGRLFQNPNQSYTPNAIMALYFDYNLNNTPHFKPDEGWYYSDINYVLLGLLIEQIDNRSLASSIRQRLLEPLHMEHTFFEYYETPITEVAILHQYVGAIDFSNINTSFDWAGGGLVSTNSDLAIFIKALFHLKLINQDSLHKMIDVKFTKENESRYGLGVYEFIVNEEVYYGHFGFFGTFIGYSPKAKTTISYCISQATPNFNPYQFISQLLSFKNN